MTTDERLEKLESEVSRAKHRNRWLLTAAGLCLGIGLVGGALLGQVRTDGTESAGPVAATPHPAGAALKEVRARKFVLEDDKGRLRASLSMVWDGPAFRLFDEKGEVRAELKLVGDEPCLALCGGKRETCVLLDAFSDAPSLSLFDEKRQLRAFLDVEKNAAGLYLFDENGEAWAQLSVEKDRPRLRLYDEKGKTAWSAP